MQGNIDDVEEQCAGEPEAGLLSHFYDIAKIVAFGVLFALIMRIFVFQPFNIPSGSMKPTLLVGDYLLISKYSYGYSRYSLPFNLKLFEGRLLASDPRRGDVVVFHKRGKDYIKRVIGLPGDRVRVVRGILQLNGEPVPRRKVEPFVTTGNFGYERPFDRYIETLPGGRGYEVLDLQPKNEYDNTELFIVPEGRFFLMGDNRDNSSDSRFPNPIGFVARENLIGKARIIYFSRKRAAGRGGASEGAQGIRWRRLLMSVR